MKSALKLALTTFFVGLALATLIVPILGGIFGNASPHLELITGHRVQYALVNLLILFGALFTRARIAIFVTSVALLYHASAIAPFYFGRPANGAGSKFRLMSYNVLFSSSRFEEVAAYVKAEQPDAAIFQEVTDTWANGLRPLESFYPFHYRAKAIDMLVYSRFPIEDPEITMVGKIRGFVRFRVSQPGGSLCVIGTHAYPQFPYGEQGFRWRNQHLVEVLPNAVNQTTDFPTIVAGDLNATMWSPQYQDMIRKTGLKNARQGFGIFPSCGACMEHTSLLAVPYDHCLVNRHVTAVRFWTGPNMGSDHCPILCDITTGPVGPRQVK